MKSRESSSNFIKYLQEAMVVIQNQRQRANLERICRSFRLHQLLPNVNEKAVEAELEAAVERGELYAVDKRGYRSYQVKNAFFCISSFCFSAILAFKSHVYFILFLLHSVHCNLYSMALSKCCEHENTVDSRLCCQGDVCTCGVFFPVFYVSFLLF